MKDVTAIRRANLAALVEANDLTSAAKRLQRAATQVNDTVAGRKSFGEKVARSMEAAWDPSIPAGWLDREGSVTSDGEILIHAGSSVSGNELRAIGVGERMAEYRPSVNAPRDGYIRIPVVDAKPSAGPGGEPVDYPVVTDYLEVVDGWARHKFGAHLEAVRIVHVGGDSMAPTMNDGDLAFVDTSVKTFYQDGIYVLVFDGRLLIKRLRANVTAQLYEVCSDNTAYPPQLIRPDEMERLHVMGLVRAWWAIRGS